MIDIASGHSENQGNFNTLKWTSVGIVGTVGKRFDEISELRGEKSNYAEGGRTLGGLAFEGADLYMGATGVSKGLGMIVDKSYKLKEITNAGNKIIPSFTVAIDNVSKTKKIGKAVSISYTSASWARKIDATVNKK